MDLHSVKVLVPLCGFVIGLIFGGTAQRTHFCTMGGIADLVTMGDSARFRAWMLAAAVAMIGSQILWSAGLIDLSGAIYRTANLGWFGAILGGVMFGYGMVLGGGCGNKTLVRIGAGNLKSLVVFMVIAATAYMTLRGLIAPARVAMEGALNVTLPASQGLDDMIGRAVGVSPGTLRAVLTVVIAGGTIVWCFKDADFRAGHSHIAAGIIIGCLIPAGWFVTSHLGQDDFDPTPVASFTFIAPIGDTLQYLMTFTGSTINFGIATVFGVIGGAFIMAKLTGTFKLEGFSNPSDMAVTMFGAVLMGAGGVMALGCTIGQGLSGVSTLAFGSFLATASIIGGALWALKAMEEGSVSAGLRAMFART